MYSNLAGICANGNKKFKASADNLQTFVIACFSRRSALTRGLCNYQINTKELMENQDNQAQGREHKICLNCGTENEWKFGQCVSCGQTAFMTPKKFAANKRNSLLDIFTSVFLVGMSFYLLHSLRNIIFKETWALLIVSLITLIAFGSLINSIYKYRHAKDIRTWYFIVLFIYIFFLAFGFAKGYLP
jgi:ribosomal protein L40E